MLLHSLILIAEILRIIACGHGTFNIAGKLKNTHGSEAVLFGDSNSDIQTFVLSGSLQYSRVVVFFAGATVVGTDVGTGVGSAVVGICVGALVVGSAVEGRGV